MKDKKIANKPKLVSLQICQVVTFYHASVFASTNWPFRRGSEVLENFSIKIKAYSIKALKFSQKSFSYCFPSTSDDGELAKGVKIK